MKLLLFLMFVPFFINDLFYWIIQDDFIPFFTVAYLTGVIPLVGVYLSLKKGYVDTAQIGLISISTGRLLLWTVILCFYGVCVDRYLGRILFPDQGMWSLYRFPPYLNEYWRWFDLTVGMLLVAVSEELVFRGVLLSFLRKHMSTLSASIVSIVVFGLIHWGRGLESVVGSCVWAILPTYFVVKYRSIYPVIIAHFVTDFLAFW